MIRIKISVILLCVLFLPALLSGCAPADVFEAGVMPRIDITTPDGDSGFATDYVRNDKLAGKIEYVDASVSVSGCEPQYALSQADAQVKVRGNYTLDYPKKSFRIKFEKKYPMLGLNEGRRFRSWVLLADWKDLSMLNNPTAFYLGREILGSDGYYCTDYCQVELYINGEYWGVYLLVEQQEAEDGRTSVPEPEKGYTGTDIGYFLEYDAYYDLEDSSCAFTVDWCGEYYIYGYTVKSDINDPAQLEFIRAYMENTYRIAHSAIRRGELLAFDESRTRLIPAQTDSVQETVGQVIDLRSMVDMFILSELCHDPDLGWSSFFMSVDLTPHGEGRLIFEAPWDFDSCFGIRSGYESPTDMHAAYAWNPWFDLVGHEPWFIHMVRERWTQLMSEGVFDRALVRIHEQRAVFAECYERNYSRWSTRITEGNGELVPRLNSLTNQGQAADYLYEWLDRRIEYLDSQWAM